MFAQWLLGLACMHAAGGLRLVREVAQKSEVHHEEGKAEKSEVNHTQSCLDISGFYSFSQNRTTVQIQLTQGVRDWLGNTNPCAGASGPNFGWQYTVAGSSVSFQQGWNTVNGSISGSRGSYRISMSGAPDMRSSQGCVTVTGPYNFIHPVTGARIDTTLNQGQTAPFGGQPDDCGGFSTGDPFGYVYQIAGRVLTCSAPSSVAGVRGDITGNSPPFTVQWRNGVTMSPGGFGGNLMPVAPMPAFTAAPTPALFPPAPPLNFFFR